jgi:hypothetical protein
MTYEELCDRLDIAIDMLGLAIDKGQPTEAARARVASARAALDAFNAGDTSPADELASAQNAAAGAQRDLDDARTPNDRARCIIRLADARSRLRDAEAAYRADIEADPTVPTGRVHHLPFTPAVEAWMGTALILEDESSPLVTRSSSGALIIGNSPDAR